MKFIFQYAPATRSHQFTYIYNMTLYNIIINNNQSSVWEKKIDSIVHSELYGSSRLAKSSTFLLKGER